MLSLKNSVQRFALFSALAAVGFLPNIANGQVRIELPEISEWRGTIDMGLLDDQRFNSSSSVSISQSTVNGVLKVRAVENGEVTVIEEDKNTGSVVVKLTRKYSSAQSEELMEDYPDLYMSLKDFPEESEGAQVEVTLNLTKSYSANSLEELKKNHPKAHAAYEKYTASDTNMRPSDLADRILEQIERGRGRGGFRGGGRIIIPEIRPTPRAPRGVPRIDVDDIRIHDDQEEDKKKGSGTKEDKDT